MHDSRPCPINPAVRGPHEAEVQASRSKLLRLIKDAPSITFIRNFGNIGDCLIHAGTRQLLAELNYTEISVLDPPKPTGGLGLLSGSGGWCQVCPHLAKFLPIFERQFDQFVVLPSSFDTSVEAVRRTLSNSKAIFFARERASYEQIRHLCQADLAHDGAFYFDYSRYWRTGSGVLTAFRTDRESIAHQSLPPENNDISLSCETLDEWLWTIARHARVLTDRAHVTIAGALLGKEVEFSSSNYHKVPALVEYSLKGFPVHLQGRPLAHERTQPLSVLAEAYHVTPEILYRTAEDIVSLLQPGEQFGLLDDGQIPNWPVIMGRARPFPELNGQFGGPPRDDEGAMVELERLRQWGAGKLAVFKTAFWWFAHYRRFEQFLHARFPCVLKNDRVLVFDLNQDAASGSGSLNSQQSV